MEEMSKHDEIGQAALKAGMDRKTARKYVAAGKLPSEMVKARDWRTRPDPFEEHWIEIEERLRETPELEAKTLFASGSGARRTAPSATLCSRSDTGRARRRRRTSRTRPS
jgi:hypothetical protein